MARKVPPFARIALDYADHPKIANLSDAAFRAHIELILYSRKYLTDGRIPTRKITQLGSDVVTELSQNDDERPSLRRDDNGDYWLYGYDYWQETKAEVDSRAQVSRSNGALGGRPKTQPGSQPGSDQVTQTKPTTKAEVEVEVEVEVEEEPKGSSSGRAPRAATRQVPETFQPSAKALEWQKTNHPNVNVADETERFVNHHRAKGSKFADLDAAWRNWIKNAVKFAAENPRHLTSVPSQPWTPPPGSPLSYVEM